MGGREGGRLQDKGQHLDVCAPASTPAGRPHPHCYNCAVTVAQTVFFHCSIAVVPNPRLVELPASCAFHGCPFG